MNEILVPARGGRETIFVEAERFALPTGSSAPTLALTGSRYPGWQMPSASDSTIRATFFIPYGWNSAHFDIYWANTVASTGNVRWGLDLAYTTPGVTIAADQASLQAVAAAGAQNVLVASRIWTAQTVGSRQIHHIRITRYGSVGTDTLTNAAGMLGLRITRAA